MNRILTLSSRRLGRYGAGLLLVCTLILAGCAAPEEEDEEAAEDQATPVAMAQVESRTLRETIQAVGSLRADQTVQISPEIAGVVEAVEYEEGDTVQRGDTLVRLDDDKLREQYDAARYSLEETRASLRNARQTFERNKRLRERDAISAQQFDDARAAYESTQARVQRLESEVESARENLEDATIRAPFTGSVGSRQVDAGNYVQPGTVLTTLYKLDPLEVRFTVPGRFANRVRTGQTVRVHLTAYPDTSFPGEVYFVSPSIREATRDLLVKARLPNTGHQLRPGSFTRVQLITETRENRPVVPAEALVPEQDGYFLFRVEDGVARRHPVGIGLREPGYVEIRDGLEPGATIVRAGQQAVADGTPVRPADSGDTTP